MRHLRRKLRVSAGKSRTRSHERKTSLIRNPIYNWIEPEGEMCSRKTFALEPHKALWGALSCFCSSLRRRWYFHNINNVQYDSNNNNNNGIYATHKLNALWLCLHWPQATNHIWMMRHYYIIILLFYSYWHSHSYTIIIILFHVGVNYDYCLTGPNIVPNLQLNYAFSY